MQWSFGWEDQFLLFLQNQVRSPWLDALMGAVTRLGDAGILAICACILLLCIPSLRNTGVMAAQSLAMDVILVNGILKTLVNRVRPYVAVEGLIPIARLPADASFPSGHTGASFAVASVIYLCMPKKIGIPVLLLAALIGFSRLYLGVHYPTDVLAGAVIGLCTGWFAVWMGKRREQRKIAGVSENKD
ncbi:MAG: phosphatase PAP2 family protein [Lachnospiraceae bacterium]|jgi:membrane-associated phospholipid phosphatase|nr:phosphatase PAP2 family protein [Lachnospiraceae bacterium]MCI8994531.1 phosphatase PAP2 family protein [Lachnospiraceae bacterium]MCI9135807.1 phosphatase PAP2 family protein [Lachnospiraceae bacterium]